MGGRRLELREFDVGATNKMALGYQTLYEMVADEAACSGDKDDLFSHDILLRRVDPEIFDNLNAPLLPAEAGSFRLIVGGSPHSPQPRGTRRRRRWAKSSRRGGFGECSA